MKIAFYLPSKHLGGWRLTNDPANDDGFNGTDSQFLQLAVQCARLGDEVTLFCTALPANESTVRLSLVVDMREAVSAARTCECDVLITNYKESGDFFDGLAEAESRSLKCVVWDQNGPTAKTRALYASLHCVARLVCVSHSQALTTADSPTNLKTAVIWNGVDTAFWAPHRPVREPLVVYLGALVETKGFHHLAAAWPVIRAAVPEARLVVVGSARLYDTGARLGSLGVATPDFEAMFTPFLGTDRPFLAAAGVSFLGLLDKRSIRDLLHKASVAVINPNVRGSLECCSVGSLESMAAGVPVVGGRAGGLRETVRHMQTGCLARNRAQLAGFISHILHDADLRDSMSRRSLLAAAETFSRGAFISNWRSLLATLDGGVPAALKPRFRSNPSLNAACRAVIAAGKQLSGQRDGSFVLEALKRLSPLT